MPGIKPIFTTPAPSSGAASPQKKLHQLLPPQPQATGDSYQQPTGKKASSVSSVPLIHDPLEIDTRAVFYNPDAATAEDIEKILKRYGSPHQGKGATVIELAQQYKINPVLMMAIMQKESSFGNKANNSRLSPENIANPWSVHFNESAKGIKKLRLKDGSMPTFERSLEAAIQTMLKLAGDSDTPLTQAGKKYSTTATWSRDINQYYQFLMKKISS